MADGGVPDLVERVRTRLAAAGGEAGVAELAAAVRAEARGVVGDADVLAAVRTLQREFVGAGPLEPLLRDPAVSDVLVTAPDAVWVDRGAGLERAGVSFADEDAVRRLAQRLAAAAGRRLDDASPYVDARLPGSGVRLHAVLPPVAADGTCVSLRVLRPACHDLDALEAGGTVDATGRALLEAVVAARLAFLVVGGTGSGKTTVLSALLARVPASERIVVVEDAEELRPAHPHVVRLVSRPANVEGAGTVLLRDLVRQALRMRPDRLVVGEVRGAEVCELLAALNTGHDGGAGTVHANSPREVPARLEALAALGGMSPAALRSQMAAAVQAVLHVRRVPDGRRVLEAVGVLRRTEGDAVTVVPAWGREEGWAPGRADLGAMLAERGVAAPWTGTSAQAPAPRATTPRLAGGVASLRSVSA
ncbi:TadA family conjugal transfer-associated ATPase [Actinomycetospora sp. NBRC 106378]|uniref:TadA family conjugal transfer-associated ATPase n=1 Tax=Actinomycetospora sp. NBRC 106378 TaxID=3032208 RepID=UPI0024A45BE8|nr:TadA family conjugal transfer-associated ATPase [Actinomycetospora sp. NBRC 106378]GLZ52911.1 conjugal transfer protein [Actinomycetospora sp. NBRC 106378]